MREKCLNYHGNFSCFGVFILFWNEYVSTWKSMKTILLFTFILFTTSHILAQGQNNKVTPIFDLKDYEVLNDSLYLIIKGEGSKNLVNLYDSNRKEYIHSFVRKGRGPGEVDLLGAYTLDILREHIFMSDFNSARILKYTLNGDFMGEKPLPIQYASSMSHYGNRVSISPTQFILEKDKDSKIIDVSFLINDSDFRVLGTLTFNVENLNLNKIESYDKIRFVELRPKVIEIVDNRFLLFFEYFNLVFLLNDSSEILDTYILDVPNFEVVKVISHPVHGYGVRRWDFFSDFARYQQDKALITFGDRSLGVPFGVLKVGVQNDRLLTNVHYLKKSTELYTESFNFSVSGDDIWGFNNVDLIELDFEGIEEH